MTTTHTRNAASVDTWLTAATTFDDEGIPTHAVGTATIRDNGTTATIAYTVQAQISHDQMLDLLEETR